MKKILAIAAVAALTAGVSAYAANPFSDVSPDDWAYQAVSDLSDQGNIRICGSTQSICFQRAGLQDRKIRLRLA